MASAVTATLQKFCNDPVYSGEGPISATVYHSLEELDRELWKCVVDEGKKFMSLEYFRALEHAENDELELRYALFRADGKIVGAAAFQITHFITSEDAYSNPLLKFAYKVTQLLRGGHVHNILICGNAIATGEHGFSFAEGFPIEKIPPLIVRAMKDIAVEEKRKGKGICAMLVKDFYPDSTEIAKGISKAGFRNFQVDHNMVMPILPEWQSFEDYLQAMVTKFRTKAKAAINRSVALRITDMSSEEVIAAQGKMQKLYDNVYGRADFRLGKMNVESVAAILENMPGNFFVKGYWLNDELVGFCTAMRCGTVLEAHIIGIDYDHNKEYAVYQRMLYDYVELAIRLRCSTIVYGRTAAEIKSTIGAVPVDLTCGILHQRRISNALLKLILQYVKPSDYPHRHPYKTEVQEKLQAQRLY